MAKVSVIMASYNHEKYVADALQSVFNQSYQDFEIIVVDDGSSDATVKIVNKFDDPRLKLFCFEKNKGACTAMHKCIMESSGEYISLLNSDDIFMPNKLEKQVNYLDNHIEIGAVFSEAQIVDEDGNVFEDRNHPYCNIFRQKNRNRYEWLRWFFYNGNCLCHPSVLIRRECYERVGIYDQRFAQLPDFDFWIRLCFEYEIYILQEKLICFRIRNEGKNASSDKPETKIRSSFELSQILHNYLNITDLAEVKKIFPDVFTDENINEELIPFLIAEIALKVNSPIYKKFALDILYQMLENENIVKKLEETFGFTYTDLYRIASQNDIYNLTVGSKPNKEALDYILNSRSWKITRPLRCGMNGLRQLLSKFTLK